MLLALTDGTFREEVLEALGVVLVDFWAPWCGPCQILGPIIDELAEDFAGRVRVGKLNVDENPQTAQAYSVMSIPLLVLFKDGQEVARMMGVQTKESLAQRIEDALS